MKRLVPNKMKEGEGGGSLGVGEGGGEAFNTRHKSNFILLMFFAT